MTEHRDVSSSRSCAMDDDIFVTIDEAHSRDLDDGIQVRRATSGWCVEVIVPDLSTAIPMGDPLDVAARERGWTRYNGTGIVTGMLPKDLTIGSLTLSADHVRPVLRFTFHLDDDLTTTSVTIARQQRRMAARLSYEQVDAILAGAAPDTLSKDIGRSLHHAWVLAESLLMKRRKGGAIVAAASQLLPSSEEGLPILSAYGKGSRAYIIVQELMILANASLATWCVTHDIPILYRNHRPTSAADRTWITEDLDRLTASADETILTRLHSLIGRATYGASAGGHWGLNLPFYAHFTSPLRRYADLVNQRQIIAFMEGKENRFGFVQLQAVADHLDALIEKDRDDRSEALRLRAHNDAVRKLARGKLTSMDSQAFARLVKLHHEGALASDLVDDFLKEAARRLHSHALSAKEMYRLFFFKDGRGAADHLKAALKDLCLQQPHAASTILEYASQMKLLSLTLDLTHAMPGGFQCTITVTSASPSGRTARAAVTAPSKQEARQSAKTQALLRLAEITIDAQSEPKPASQTTDRAPVKSPSSGNPKSVLNEIALGQGVPHPVYEHEENQVAASVHAVKGIVTLGGRRIETEAFSAGRKKDAQKLAARALLDQIGGAWLRRAQAGDNPLSVVNEAVQAGQGSIEFLSDASDPPKFQHRARCRFTHPGRGHSQATIVSDWHTAATRKEAETKAAAEIIQHLERT